MKSDRMNSFVVGLLVAAALLIMAITLIGCRDDRNLISELEEVRIQLNKAEAENSEIKAALKELRSEFSDISGTAEAMESLLSSSSKDLTAAFRSGLLRNEQLIKEKEDTLSQIQEELKNFQVKISGLDEKNQEGIESLEGKIDDLSKLLDRNTDEMGGLSGSLENLRTLHASLKSNLEQAMALVKPTREMKKLLEDHHIQIVELQESLRKKSDSFNREMTRMAVDIKELRLEITRLDAIKSGD
ncbi:MAG: hypothetical protein ABIJ42_02270 [Acidobacteriota bacterium]